MMSLDTNLFKQEPDREILIARNVYQKLIKKQTSIKFTGDIKNETKYTK